MQQWSAAGRGNGLESEASSITPGTLGRRVFLAAAPAPAAGAGPDRLSWPERPAASGQAPPRDPMKLTARISSLLTALLAIACFVGAAKSFRALAGITDAAQLRDARGFGWFAVFLGIVFLGIAALSWWIVGAEREES